MTTKKATKPIVPISRAQGAKFAFPPLQMTEAEKAAGLSFMDAIAEGRVVDADTGEPLTKVTSTFLELRAAEAAFEAAGERYKVFAAALKTSHDAYEAAAAARDVAWTDLKAKAAARTLAFEDEKAAETKVMELRAKTFEAFDEAFGPLAGEN